MPSYFRDRTRVRIKWRNPGLRLVGRTTPVRAVVGSRGRRRAEDCPPYQNPRRGYILPRLRRFLHCYRPKSSRLAKIFLGRRFPTITRTGSLIGVCPRNTRKARKLYHAKFCFIGVLRVFRGQLFFMNHPSGSCRISEPSCGNSETEGKAARVAASERG
jgi:hypothetical protein